MSLERHIDLAQLGVFMSAKKPFPLRVPTDVKAWMKEQADLNGSSQNTQVRQNQPRFSRFDVVA